MESILLLLCLLLVVASAFLEAAVPEGKCVEIRNRHVDRYLVSSTNYDPERRHLAKDAKGHQWIITREKHDIYRIKHAKLGEELFESSLKWNGNYVFTWIPKKEINDNGASWRLKEVEPQFFTIKNVKFNHCLYTSELTTWIGAYKDCNTHKYQWQFVEVKCE